MDLTRYQHTETTTIAAPPERVYELLADVTRMGDWSPVCTGAEWDDGSRAWFTGTNRNGERTWQTRCRVEVARPGAEFTFVNGGMTGDSELVRWSYTFSPVDSGTEVRETWQVLDGYAPFMKGIAPDMDVEVYLEGVVEPTRQGMATTLANLKRAAES